MTASNDSGQAGALALVRRLIAHAAWADLLLWNALEQQDDVPPLVWQEYLHVLGAESVWLARLELRPVTSMIWPTGGRDEARALRSSVRVGYEAYSAGLDDESLHRPVAYRNSAGDAFSNPPIEVLTHVALHGQYHRGKINVLLRQASSAPAPVDYISFVRGVPAAVTQPPLR